MTYDVLGPGGLDYLPCRYGTSKLLFRGPQRDLNDPFVAFVGGTETYGKFVPTPFAMAVEQRVGVTCANLGIANAGLDAFLGDGFVMDTVVQARVTVVQALDASNLSNRFYRVHPRRNDRFIEALPPLRALYPDVDFAQFHFTQHLLNYLQVWAPERFVMLRRELEKLWVDRMRQLLGQVAGRAIVIWAARDLPDDYGSDASRPDIPAFVSKRMLQSVEDLADETVLFAPSEAARAKGTDGMVFNELEAHAASSLMGAPAHEELAARLVPLLDRLIV
ncbi:DUF6473 family protein [Sulfitobacter sp. S190]|uniref:DUF6473 family protein n=1 Tax=Sulfitobacter sp. S190 TaxID=2867022 RepID=UPI0021A8D4C5|nr:DUF6473 family protein [Sulfitobacter sp. S190]